MKRTRDKGHPRRRGSILLEWYGPEVAEGVGDVGGVGSRCLSAEPVEGTSRNLFQYLERENERISPLAFFPAIALSIPARPPCSFSSLPSAVHRTFNESFIPLLTPFEFGVHREVVLGVRLAAGRTPDFQPLLPGYGSFQSRQGNSVSQIAPRERKGTCEGRKGGGRARYLVGYFRGKCFGCYLPKDQSTRA